MNEWRNREEAAKYGHSAVLVESVGVLSGATAPTQDMLLWPKLKLIGCCSINARIVNGVVYEVDEVDATTVKVVMTEELRANMAEMMNPATQAIIKGKSGSTSTTWRLSWSGARSLQQRWQQKPVNARAPSRKSSSCSPRNSDGQTSRCFTPKSLLCTVTTLG